MAPPLASLGNALLAHAPRIAVALLITGVLGMLTVPILERPIDFDENALLAGAARPTLRCAAKGTRTPGALSFGRSFAADLVPHWGSDAFGGAVQEALSRRLGLAVYNHSWSPSGPWAPQGSWRGGGGGGSGLAECVSVHAVLHCPRCDGKEALLLVTPLLMTPQALPGGDFEQDAGGVALALALGSALLRHLGSGAPWLAKDVVWLLPDASCGLVAAMGAWADAYAGQGPQGGLSHFARAGLVGQAVVLETPAISAGGAALALHGADGLLPRLDMYWLLRWYAAHYLHLPLQLDLVPSAQPITPVLHGAHRTLLPTARMRTVAAAAAAVVPQWAVDAALRHAHALASLGRFAAAQAAAAPGGGHGPLKQLGTDAVTLRLLPPPRPVSDRDVSTPAPLLTPPRGFVGPGAARVMMPSAEDHVRARGSRHLPPPTPDDALLAGLAECLELALRSCSGLVERFHHSLFLYALTGPDSYVSVERYICPVVLLIAALALRGAALLGGGTGGAAGGAAGGGAGDGTTSRTVQQSVVQGISGSGRPSCTASAALCVPLSNSKGASGGRRPWTDSKGASGRRQPWTDALRRVASVHAVCAVTGTLVRTAPAMSAAAARWTAAWDGGDWRWCSTGAAAPTLCALFAAAALAEVLGVSPGSCMSSWLQHTTSTSHASKHASTATAAHMCSTAASALGVELCIAAAALAGEACLNWAAAYAAALLLSLLALCVAPLADGKGAVGTCCRSMAAVAAIVAASPCGVAAMLAMASSRGFMSLTSRAWLEALAWGSSPQLYALAWGVWLPAWVLSAWSAAVLMLYVDM